jgi:hypothetical protein
MQQNRKQMAKVANLAVVDKEEPRHSFVMVGGRGKTGKSVIIRTLVELAVERGGLPIIGDIDRTNQSLSAFAHLKPNIRRPPHADDVVITDWLNEQVNEQIDGAGNTLILDCGGGDQIGKFWVRDLDLAPFLESHGVRPVVIHMLGADEDDLAYMRDLETVSKFQPRDTVIVLNEGVIHGRSPAAAFGSIADNAIFRSVIDRGARVLRLPRLGCMVDVDRLRVSFREAAAGALVDGKARLGPIQRQMVTLWMREATETLAPILPWIK